jgi:hypothetical protein
LNSLHECTTAVRSAAPLRGRKRDSGCGDERKERERLLQGPLHIETTCLKVITSPIQGSLRRAGR